MAEREEILRHKWIESEKVGHDIGFERALLDWIRKHRESWKTFRKSSVSNVGVIGKARARKKDNEQEVGLEK